MIINDMPLQALKDILASDTPLAIQTTEALITRLESLGMRLDTMRRQRDGYRTQYAATIIKHEQAERYLSTARTKLIEYKTALTKTEQALTRVSTLFEGVHIEHHPGVNEDLNATIRATIKGSDTRG